MALEHVAVRSARMPCPNLPEGFDFLDPDINVTGLPVKELAEVRKSEPVHWVDVPGGTGGFWGKSYWLVPQHPHVKEGGENSHGFCTSPGRAPPRWAQEETP